MSKEALTELKSYTKPAPIVVTVMSAVLILLHHEDTSWSSAKKLLTESNLLKTLKEYDIEQSTTRTVLHRVSKLKLTSPEVLETVRTVSSAAAAICEWAVAVEQYATINTKKVIPKRERLQNLEKQLKVKQESLKMIRAELDVVGTQIEELQKHYDSCFVEKKELEDQAQALETKLMRAGQLVEGLSEFFENFQ